MDFDKFSERIKKDAADSEKQLLKLMGCGVLITLAIYAALFVGGCFVVKWIFFSG